jgi:hypothetical protein
MQPAGGNAMSSQFPDPGSTARAQVLGVAVAAMWAVALMIMAWPQARYWLTAATPTACQAMPGPKFGDEMLIARIASSDIRHRCRSDRAP